MFTLRIIDYKSWRKLPSFTLRLIGRCLRNRKHFPCFYRVIETRVEVWEKREIAWEHEHEVRVFPRNFEFLPNFHKCFYNSIGTRKKCFLFPLLFCQSFGGISRRIRHPKRQKDYKLWPEDL